MARPVITIGGKEVSLEARSDGGTHTGPPANRQPVTIAAQLPRSNGQDNRTCPRAAIPLGAISGILLLGLVVLLVMRHVGRHRTAADTSAS